MTKWLIALFSAAILGTGVSALEKPVGTGGTQPQKTAPHPPTIFRPAKKKPAVERPKPTPPDEHAPSAKKRGSNGRSH